MKMLPHSISSVSVALVVAVGFLGLSIAAAQAQMAPISVLGKGSPAVKTAAGKGRTHFDWLNQGTSAPVIKVADIVAPPGNGSWVCSPAGFGSKSRCYRR